MWLYYLKFDTFVNMGFSKFNRNEKYKESGNYHSAGAAFNATTTKEVKITRFGYFFLFLFLFAIRFLPVLSDGPRIPCFHGPRVPLTLKKRMS